MNEATVLPQKGLTFEDVWAALMEDRKQMEESFRRSEERWAKIEEQQAKNDKKWEESNKRWDENVRQWKESNKKWEESVRQWKENDRKWEESNKKWEESVRQWKENDRKWEESNKKWEESGKRWEEGNKKWDELNKRMGDLHNSIGELTEILVAARLWEKFNGYPYNLKRAYLNVQIFDEDSEQVGEIDILLSNTNWVMPVEVKRNLKVSDIPHHVKRMELIRKYPPAEAAGKKMVAAIAGGFVPKEARLAAHEAGFFVLELSGETVTLCPPPAGFKPREW